MLLATLLLALEETLIDALFSENAETAELLAERIGEIVDNSDNLSDDELCDALCDLVFTFIDKCKVYVISRICKQMIAKKQNLIQNSLKKVANFSRNSLDKIAEL